MLFILELGPYSPPITDFSTEHCTEKKSINMYCIDYYIFDSIFFLLKTKKVMYRVFGILKFAYEEGKIW